MMQFHTVLRVDPEITEEDLMKLAEQCVPDAIVHYYRIREKARAEWIAEKEKIGERPRQQVDAERGNRRENRSS
jgi:hypothetical protein